MGWLDWLRKTRAEQAEPAAAWSVHVESGEVVAEDGHGNVSRAALRGARSVRVVPLTGGDHHGARAGRWQVTLSSAAGDVLLGKPLAGWQSAWELAGKVCGATELPLDELTRRMFSRVGQFSVSSKG